MIIDIVIWHKETTQVQCMLNNSHLHKLSISNYDVINGILPYSICYDPIMICYIVNEIQEYIIIFCMVHVLSVLDS